MNERELLFAPEGFLGREKYGITGLMKNEASINVVVGMTVVTLERKSCRMLSTGKPSTEHEDVPLMI